jgi:hypothetical protein
MTTSHLISVTYTTMMYARRSHIGIRYWYKHEYAVPNRAPGRITASAALGYSLLAHKLRGLSRIKHGRTYGHILVLRLA